MNASFAFAAILSIRFKSTLEQAALMEVCQEDLSLFRAVEGLSQKYYISDPVEGVISGFYALDTVEAREAFLGSALAKSIPSRYGVLEESLRMERYQLALSLRE